MTISTGIPPRGMFTGLSAFPLTPLRDDQVDDGAFRSAVRRLAGARVDSITALGSTGLYAYLARGERAAVIAAAVEEAAGIPVFAGIGSLRTSDVLRFAEDAQAAGASAVLLAPMSYQSLTVDDVFALFEDVERELSVPLIVYDNPGTTHFTFTDELYAAVARLPRVASVKIPGLPADPGAARERVDSLRALLPADVTLGISGDAAGARGLSAGCEAWYSVIAGTLPEHPSAITAAARSGDAALARSLAAEWQPLWELFAVHGSLRVTAAIAESLGWAHRSCLPRPILGLGEADRQALALVLESIGVRPATGGRGLSPT